MPEADRLQVLDAHNLAELTGVHDLLHRCRVRRVTHHVSDGKHHPGALGSRDDPAARLLIRGHRLLHQDVVAKRSERLDWIGVHPVLGADQHSVGEPLSPDQLTPVSGSVPGCDAVRFGEPVTADLPRLRDRHDAGT